MIMLSSYGLRVKFASINCMLLIVRFSIKSCGHFNIFITYPKEFSLLLIEWSVLFDYVDFAGFPWTNWLALIKDQTCHVQNQMDCITFTNVDRILEKENDLLYRDKSVARTYIGVLKSNFCLEYLANLCLQNFKILVKR